ncbi:NADP-dependent isocitrate dehydrogenase [Limobrevibacterium gyesilva]|uniref:Isocitrate dehydrogenase [NADP] n=1 Tax=Limobrevibacterium gyesilva TaxID=2991712 RepID=A0AA41YP69_9PROT|nr:NADP-dependent isocitrate dehydrogenase [Limobrevibacterium gyesilva]MCW3477516.1 NADP-dependent isocitrate dehydrogenase [Limobrevibacterium gyesilva]
MDAVPQTPRITVTAIPGDGIGPEVMRATQRILAAAGARIDWEEAEAGAAAFRKGIATGCPQETLDSIERTGVALKGPLETALGYGEKSANVTLRKFFELYGNIRPVRELPGIRTPFSGRGIDLVIVRENVEDLYAGIEYLQTPSVAQCLKLMSEPGCERILRLAYALARAEGRTRLACSTKANIMKTTEGLMKRVFERIAPEYPDIAPSHLIIDNCAHQLVIAPEQFELIVTSNMNGDIISDLAAGLVGGLGIAPSSNVGDRVAMFEAVHGSAPQIAGKGLANPTALLLSAVMLLRHVGDFAAAERVEQAVFVTLQEGRNLTGDIAPKGEGAGTDAFTDQVIANLGRGSDVPSRAYHAIDMSKWTDRTWHRRADSRELVGLDVFIESEREPAALAAGLEAAAAGTAFALKMLSNRGTQVWPPTGGHSFRVDHFQCRFVLRGNRAGNYGPEIAELMRRVSAEHQWMHVEKLQRFDGADAFAKAQGES